MADLTIGLPWRKEFVNYYPFNIPSYDDFCVAVREMRLEEILGIYNKVSLAAERNEPGLLKQIREAEFRFSNDRFVCDQLGIDYADVKVMDHGDGVALAIYRKSVLAFYQAFGGSDFSLKRADGNSLLPPLIRLVSVRNSR